MRVYKGHVQEVPQDHGPVCVYVEELTQRYKSPHCVCAYKTVEGMRRYFELHFFVLCLATVTYFRLAQKIFSVL